VVLSPGLESVSTRQVVFCFDLFIRFLDTRSVSLLLLANRFLHYAMPNLLDRHRQTTMTQQFRTEKRSDNDDSLPPNWGHFQDPATGRYISRHSTTHEVVFKVKHLFKKPGARKNRPDADAATPPSKKKKKIKDEETEAAAPDVIPSIPVFITLPTAKHRTQSGVTNSMDPIELLDSNSSSSSAKNEELSDLSETEAPCIPSKPDNFQSENSSSGSNGNGLPNTEDFQYISAFQKAQAKQSSSGTADDGNSDNNDDDDESKTLV
jgi:hypothetical protein